jgi:hypothetical protein
MEVMETGSGEVGMVEMMEMMEMDLHSSSSTRVSDTKLL